MASHGVIVAVTGAGESAIAAAIDAHPRLTVVRRCADVAEALAAAAAGVGQVVVVSDQQRLTRGTLTEFAATGVALVGVATSPDADTYLRAIGVEHVAPAGASATDVAATADRVAGTGPGPRPLAAEMSGDGDQPRADGIVIAVWGPTGAPGRTTLAVNLGAELAALGSRTLVVDADTYGGAVAQACGLTDETPGIAAVARAAQTGTLDHATLSRHALEIGPRLRVLTGITRPGRWHELSASALGELWNCARTWADATVVDCGFGLENDEELTYDTAAPQRNAATLSALRDADQIVAVGSAEPLGMQRLVHGVAALADLGLTDPTVVVNRVRADVAGPRPEEAVADVLMRFARVERTWTIPWDPKACDAAVLAGQTLTERAPRSRARKAIAGLAVSLDAPLGPSSGAATPSSSRRVGATVGN